MAARSSGLVFKSSLVGCCIAALLAGGPQAFAQEAAPAAESSDAIVVTAQRRAERNLDVPITVTTLNAQQLESAGANQLNDIAQVTPGLRFDSAANLVQPTIRGVGTAVATSGGGANVGIYVDGFYSVNPAAADFELMNIESVQVLKGPQGTLFGRNTTGGAILVSTGRPDFEPSFQVQATHASRNTQRYQAYATTGLTENVAIDLEGLVSSGDGFTHNIVTGSNRDGEYNNSAWRFGLRWDVSDDVSVLFRYAHSNNDDPTMLNTNIYTGPEGYGPQGVGTNYITYPSTYATDPDEVATTSPISNTTETDSYQLTITADLGFADLTSYTQFRTEDTLYREDLDHTSRVSPFLLQFGVEDETVSQEFLLTSHPGTPMQWTAGVFYFKTNDSWPTWYGFQVPTPTSVSQFGGSATTTISYAAFADVTYEINPQLFLTGGLRYSRDEVVDAFYNMNAFTMTPFVRVEAPDYSDDHITPRLVLRYEPTPTSSVYVSYTQGYKAGIIDVGGATTNHVEPENIDAYEVGYKYDNGGFAFDLSSFYYDYANLQVSVYSGVAGANIVNAAAATIYGVEGALRWQVTDQFSVNGGVAWTHARYDRFENAPFYLRCTDPGVGASCFPGQSFGFISGGVATDTTMQRSPEWTANLGALYNIALGGAGELALSGNLYYTSEFYHGPSGTQFLEDAYHTLALRAEWTDPTERWSIAAFGDNVTDERFRRQVQYNQSGIGAVWNSPATYGVTIGYHY